MTPPAESERLTPKQEERRARVIQAALTLAADGGYDAVQMREVAQSADVALGTIYRYFESKDHLLAAAWVEWTAELQARVAKVPPRGRTVTEKMVDVLRRACRAMERRPQLVAALVKSLSSSDEGVNDSAYRVRDQIDAIADGILHDLDDEVREGVVAVIRHVWYSALMGWANGRTDIRAVGDELERAARLLLAAYDGGGNGRA